MQKKKNLNNMQRKQETMEQRAGNEKKSSHTRMNQAASACGKDVFL